MPGGGAGAVTSGIWEALEGSPAEHPLCLLVLLTPTCQTNRNQSSTEIISIERASVISQSHLITELEALCSP